MINNVPMKTQIIVKLQIEGIHAWPTVPEELVPHVGFLAFPHRHMFHIKATKAVTHNDRDIEIIDLKRKILHYLSDRYATSAIDDVKMWHDFKDMSCEMIAQELCSAFGLDSCEVLEDNENGAIVEVELSNSDEPNLPLDIGHRDVDTVWKPAITFLCGPLCSGKTFYKTALLRNLNDGQNQFCQGMEISDIVKSILNKSNRVDLQGHPELDEEIVKQIRMSVLSNPTYEHVISGVRQMSILKAFPHANLIWVDASEEVRYNRFLSNKKDIDKTRHGFDIANAKDNELGLAEVKKYIFTRNN